MSNKKQNKKLKYENEGTRQKHQKNSNNVGIGSESVLRQDQASFFAAKTFTMFRARVRRAVFKRVSKVIRRLLVVFVVGFCFVLLRREIG